MRIIILILKLMLKFMGMFVVVCISVLLFGAIFMESSEMAIKTGNIEYYAIIFFYSAIYAELARIFAPFLFYYYSEANAGAASVLSAIIGIVIFVYGFYLNHGGPPLF